jgi:adhesin transport system membrane fusion protein
MKQKNNPDNQLIVENLPDMGVSIITYALFAASVTTCMAFFFWAHTFTIDIVSIANGDVIPSSQVKSVQHLEGGIVLEIFVKEGELVKDGQQLIVLERTKSGADVGELKVRLLSLRAEIIRLETEIVGKDTINFPEDMRNEHSEIMLQTNERFTASRNAYDSRRNTQRETVSQRQQKINEINSGIENQSRTIKLLDEQVAISLDLLSKDLTNRYRHLDLLKEQSELRGRLAGDRVAVKRARAALEEANLQLGGIMTSYRDAIAKELSIARTSFDELSQRQYMFEDNLARTVLRAPVNGVIKTLYINTVGGVLSPGDVVADIVPVGDKLIIEAELPTQDIGYVSTGQPAVIRLASADAVRYGKLDGIVTNVSPDTLITQEGAPFYKVRIETKSDHFRRGSLQYQLFPGMQVIASIQTGERTVLEYLSDPFLSSIGDALGER